jgi:hypothetical protein
MGFHNGKNVLWLKLLTTTKLPHTFWIEVIITTSYIQNYCHTSLILVKTPFELWVDMHPDLCHLCTFKCPTYEHVPDEKRKKLDSKTQKCTFVYHAPLTLLPNLIVVPTLLIQPIHQHTTSILGTSSSYSFTL